MLICFIKLWIIGTCVKLDEAMCRQREPCVTQSDIVVGGSYPLPDCQVFKLFYQLIFLSLCHFIQLYFCLVVWIAHFLFTLLALKKNLTNLSLISVLAQKKWNGAFNRWMRDPIKGLGKLPDYPVSWIDFLASSRSSPKWLKCPHGGRCSCNNRPQCHCWT